MQEDRWRTRRGLALGLLALNAAAWLIPGDVVELVLRQRPVLLGRYSEGQLTALLLGTPILVGVALVLWSRIALDRKLLYRLSALVGALLISLVAVDLAARTARTPRYLERRGWAHERVMGQVRARPPNQVYQLHIADEPPTARSYPAAPPGFPSVEVTLSTDRRGFRNLTDLDRYEIVTLGDSFAEGSRVSDHESWPARVAGRLGRSLYNLALSGSSPPDYAANLRAYVAELEPGLVLCMFYEGNDFKVHADQMKEPLHRAAYGWVRDPVKQSPILLAFRRGFVRRLGSVNAGAALPEHPALSFMPVAVRAGPSAPYAYYSFKPKRLLRLVWDEASFRESKGWRDAMRAARDIKRTCAEHGIRLIFVYAPSKPHVVLPLVRERVAAEALHAFAAVREEHLPPPAEFERQVWTRLDNPERVFREFCAAEGIEFISPTRALREQAAAGAQVYYTYDQHWTRLGHQVVAQEIVRYLEGAGPRVTRRSAPPLPRVLAGP